MDNIKPEPYKGNDEYIFISYSHKRMEEAFEIISKLQADGYRVWYDEGIDPGTEYHDIIAEHVENCSVFMALLSEEYVNSEFCKKEFFYANNLKKTRLVIYLNEVKLTGGLRMELSVLQAIHKYKYTNIKKFYDKIYECKGIEKCLGNKLATVSKTVATPKPEKTNNTSDSIKDASDRIDEAYDHCMKLLDELLNKETLSIGIKSVGDIVEFGSYPQSEIKGSELTSSITGANYDSNGVATVGGMKVKRLKKSEATYVIDDAWGSDTCKYFKYEPIRWIVQEKGSDTATLVAEKVIDDQRYHESRTDITWADCTLRKWLSNDFYQKAFTDAERSIIASSDNYNEAGGSTTDKVYLLSEYETWRMFINDDDRVAYSTNYANLMGAHSSSRGSCDWWLRSRVSSGLEAHIVWEVGTASLTYYVDSNCVGVRPALKVKSSVEIKPKEILSIGNKSVGDIVELGDIVEFGSYPQSEIKGSELTRSITGAKYDRNGVATVGGMKVKRLKKSKATDVRDDDWGSDKCKYFKYEPIRWIVKEKGSGTATLVAEKVIDDQRYHKSWRDTTWANCTLRKWLSKDFYQKAFTDAERSIIASSNNDNNAGGSTTDKVYLLSSDEAWSMFKNYYDRVAYSTNYANLMGADSGSSWWWLRSSGSSGSAACRVSDDGSILHNLNLFFKDHLVNALTDNYLSYDIGVRPALKVNL